MVEEGVRAGGWIRRQDLPACFCGEVRSHALSNFLPDLTRDLGSDLVKSRDEKFGVDLIRPDNHFCGGFEK